VRQGGDAFERYRVLASAKPAAPARGSVLQPILYSPIAAWALLDEDAGSSPTMLASVNADRVSGAYPLTRAPGTVAASADLIKQYRSPYGGASARSLGRDNGAGGGVEAALKLTGEVTISMRAWWNGSKSIAYPALVDVSEGWPARNGTNGLLQCFYRLYIDTAADGAIGAYHQRALGGYSYTDVGWISTLKMNPGAWTYLALRRSAAGAYTLTRDDVHQSSGNLGNLPDPQYGTGAFNIGQWGSAQLSGSFYAGADAWLGGYADVMIWGQRLTDAQIANQRAVMFAVGTP
jgi:hypothetical protein